MAKVLIIGAGVAGLSAAWHARQRGHEVLVLEEKKRWGGLLDHFELNGFRFDNGVHFAFSSNEKFQALLDQTDYITHRPEPYNYENGRWLKHPVQNNLYPLPVEEKIEAIKGFIERPGQTETHEHYRQWLDQQFGTVIAERFPARYTEKYWTVPATQLSTEWVGKRLYRPSLNEVLLGAMSENTPQTYYLKEMLYPSTGGFRSFLDPLTEDLVLRTGNKVVVVNPRRKFVELSDGTREYYDLLASSAPLPELVKMIDNLPDAVKDAADSLWATSIALVSLGFNQPQAGDHLWFYIYDQDILPSRVHAPYRKSADNAPPGKSSLQFEIYYSRYKPLTFSPEELTEQVIAAAEKLKLASKETVVAVDYRLLPYAFVVFDRGMTGRRNFVLDQIRGLGIVPLGRFGLWDYLWSDQSFLSGSKIDNRVDMI
jgi:protoporphyrinogen oxidase